MKISLTATACAATVLFAASALPALATEPAASGYGPVPFSDMDSNRDGFVTADEYRAASDARHEQERAEYEKRRDQYRDSDESPRHSDMDADRDGKVSHEEFEAFSKKHMEEREQERARREQEHMKKREEMQKQYEEHEHEHEHGSGKD